MTSNNATMPWMENQAPASTPQAEVPPSGGGGGQPDNTLDETRPQPQQVPNAPSGGTSTATAAAQPKSEPPKVESPYDNMPQFETPKFEYEAERPQRGTTYADIFAAMNPDPRMTPEEELQYKRRERANRTIAALSDGISAIGNIWATTHGSPNLWDGSPTMSELYDDMYAKDKADRQRKIKEYLAGYEKAVGKDNEDYKTALSEYHRDRSEALAAFNADLRAGKVTMDMKQNYINNWYKQRAEERAAAKAIRDQEMHNEKVLTERNRRKNDDSRTGAAWLRARKAGSGGSSSTMYTVAPGFSVKASFWSNGTSVKKIAAACSKSNDSKLKAALRKAGGFGGSGDADSYREVLEAACNGEYGDAAKTIVVNAIKKEADRYHK